MNPEKPSREEIEAKLTALLLGELPAEEAQLLRWAISQDAALAQLHERLKLTVGFVREVAAHPADATPAQTTPLKLSGEKREKLLAHFKTVRPIIFLPPLPPKRRQFISLLEIAAVLTIVAVLAAMLLPSLAAAKRKAQNISAMNQAKMNEMDARLVPENTITVSPSTESERRVDGLEAYFQNANPSGAKGALTQNVGDAWKNQTKIVLPAGGTEDKELAAASPAPSELPSMDFSGGAVASAQNVHIEHLDIANHPEVLGTLQNTFPSGNNSPSGVSQSQSDLLTTRQQQMNSASSSSSGFASAQSELSLAYVTPENEQKPDAAIAAAVKSRGGFGGRGGGGGGGFGGGRGGSFAGPVANAPTAPIVAPPPPEKLGLPDGELENSTVSGFVAANDTGAQPSVGSTRFYTSMPSGSGTGQKSQAPMLGDIPAVGNLFKDRTESAGEKSADNAVVDKSGNIALADDLSQPRAGAVAPPVSQNAFEARLTSQNQAVASSASAPTVSPLTPAAMPPPVFLAREAQLGVDVYDQGQAQLQPQSAIPEDRPLPKTPSPAPIPQPEILTGENAFSTFSLNVSDVSFKLAAASLDKGQLPDAASIRSEEFINAFDYHDPEPAAGVPVAFVAERARDPFAHNRDLLRFSIKTAAAGRQPGRPLNIVLLLDNSGSMERADRVAIIHEALKVLASQLQPQDTLSIVTFARTARLWVDGARGDQAGTAVNQVSNLTPEGGTNLEEAMNLAYVTARRHYLANGVNRVVLLTDGAANLGNVDPEALKQKVESFRKQGIALDCFGIGWEGYNDDLLEQLSSNGDGRYGFINTPEAATTEFAAQLAGALHVAAEDVKVQVEFNPQRVISWRQIGYAKHQLTKEQFRDNTVAAAPMAAREAGNTLYTVEVNPQGSGPVATVRVRFRVPGTMDVSEHEWQVPFDGTAPALEKSSPALRLAATASAFSEWLAQSQFAQEVTTDQLLNYLNGVPAIYGADARPKQLETMIREAKSISGK